VGKPEGNTPLGRQRRGWVDIIKMDIREIGWSSMDRIDVTPNKGQLRYLVNTVMNFRIP
jgi:hypothetical protein